MAKTNLAALPELCVASRQEWRQWLEANHATAPGVWLVYYKKSSGQPSLSWAEAVQEALCFGWIDSKANTIDEYRYKQVFTPRKPRSVWSKINKQYIERLSAEGLMRPAGLEAIEVAKQNGSWTSIDSSENLEVPADLADALAAHDAARRNFEAFSPSNRKMLLQWLLSAKRPETRTRRVAEIVQMVAANQTLVQAQAQRRQKLS
ncbi:YdeI/OmpD-associated family protein [Solirubrum puertoriconensis]|uniref:Bacteriocin-protection protein n=1 Tax=Solirubrum puertoriconensis TaxID=1751427 RepID=A0A9X0L3I6_SOLP1|nr:YdeI/OmpD-associated family protein [Solirubrum puertoriconensis]KUG06502.1 hypothetical protein ASU33_03870 [Solirubrum puertoriconensis]